MTLSDEAASSLGAVVEQGRGSLPFALVHGEALVAAAAWSLGASGVTPVDLGTAWAGLVDAGEPFVLHDSLCPMTPPAFIAQCVTTAVTLERVTVGVLGRGETATVCSPIVLPVAVVAALDGLPSLDFSELVADLERRGFPVERIEGPESARRVGSAQEIKALEISTREDHG